MAFRPESTLNPKTLRREAIQLAIVAVASVGIYFTGVRALQIITGVVDISQLPQMLIQRVDVVTGGVSAEWGSDAVSGVVNFIFDKKFEGFKLDEFLGRVAEDRPRGSTTPSTVAPSFAIRT